MNEYKAEDVANPKCYAHPEKFDVLFTRLRKENPVCWTEPEGFRPFWLITKFADLSEVDTHPDIFLHAPQVILTPMKVEDELTARYGRPYSDHSSIRMDPPEHEKYVALVRDWFKPQNVQLQKNKTIKIANEYIDNMASFGGKCDFVEQISNLYTLRIILMILGVPLSDEDYLYRLTMEFHAPEDPDINFNKGRIDTTITVDKFMDYFKKLAKDRKENPQDDLATIIARSQVDGKPIAELELLSYYMQILNAGHKSTGGVLAGFMLVLAQRPDLLEQLKADPKLIPSAMEEMIRWTVPVKTFVRTAARDYEIRGQKIKEGDRLVLCYQSACRDEEIIDDPFTIRFNRKPNRHLAFGSGTHQCVGQHLARLELTTMAELLLPRLKSVALNGEPKYLESSLISGLKKLPIKYELN